MVVERVGLDHGYVRPSPPDAATCHSEVARTRAGTSPALPRSRRRRRESCRIRSRVWRRPPATPRAARWQLRLRSGPMSARARSQVFQRRLLQSRAPRDGLRTSLEGNGEGIGLRRGRRGCHRRLRGRSRSRRSREGRRSSSQRARPQASARGSAGRRESRLRERTDPRPGRCRRPAPPTPGRASARTRRGRRPAPPRCESGCAGPSPGIDRSQPPGRAVRPVAANAVPAAPGWPRSPRGPPSSRRRTAVGQPGVHEAPLRGPRWSVRASVSFEPRICSGDI